MSKRVEILNRAAELTGGDRNKTYGDPAPNLALTAELFQLCESAARISGRMNEAETGAMQLVCAKLARICTGPVYHEDNYTDLAAYAAIMGEVAE